VSAALLALGVVFLAELGDKTQLVAASLATRYRAGLVLAGIAVAFAVTQAFAVTVGAALGAALPDTAVGVGAGLLFLGFAVWAWLDVDDDDDEELVGRTGGGLRAFAGVIVAMMVAELGDKSMLASATLAADRNPFWVWVGGTTGEVLAAGLGVVVGTVMGARLPQRSAKRVAAVLFALFGVLMLADALR
jgi:Ca2+/H+ antiporter, TMEM165/GDT1 family